MPAGFVDLDVRYKDAVTLQGVAVESIVGSVYNALGALVAAVLPLAEVDADGVIYYTRDYDVRDATKFAGLFLTVEWSAVYRGVALPLYTKRYDYAPVARCAAQSTVIEWLPCTDPNVLFYEISRRRADFPNSIYVGRSFGPAFVDKTVFANEFEARSWQYWIQQYARTPGFIQLDGSDYTLSGGPFRPTRIWRSSSPMCLITGNVADITGGSGIRNHEDRKHPEVIFTPHPRHTQQLVGGTYIMPEDIVANVALDGFFSVALMQDTIVEFRVSSTYFRGELIVPRRDEATLADVEVRIIRDY